METQVSIVILVGNSIIFYIHHVLKCIMRKFTNVRYWYTLNLALKELYLILCILLKRSLKHTKTYAIKNTKRKCRMRAVPNFSNIKTILQREWLSIWCINRISLKSHKTICLYEWYNIWVLLTDIHIFIIAKFSVPQVG
jgi:hypothetical protein